MMMLRLPSTMMMRLSSTLLLGAALTTGVFWVLWSLVGQPINVDEGIQATRIEFSRLRHDTDVASKRDKKVEREPPPAPQVPRISPTMASIDTSLSPLSVNFDMGLNMKLGADTDVIPLVRIPPEYPRRAAQKGIEGSVLVQFTITATGSVTDAKVVAAQPPGLFDEAAIRSILRWRYNPKIEDGVAVERVGVRTTIRFEMDQSEKQKEK
ncbi:MAG TPA: energy transducer TonB [Gammaproteobacteria bacterium]|nr:energy transducer TonB [Gammaproteobacteria bacterium]